MIKTLIAASILLGALTNGMAEETKKTDGPTVTYQTRPGTTSRDWTTPSLVTEGNVTYQVKPGTTGRDWTAPSWETKNGETYQVKPGTTSRDWTAPSFRTDKK